ncbi:MAG: hypothetical protein GF383_05990 [Candidatus Lokiarchaeota archaeon]|nr:hypothetical protein [Candidatus Lokiarchaeota archaeon]MBD3339493.1 hypothetical protein [Candidatus Lokiarchaeota archaeon]
MILEKTIDLINQIYRTHKIIPPVIRKVVIGLGYTAVEITPFGFDPFLGLAYTLPDIIKRTNCSKIQFAGKLTSFSLNEMLSWAIEPPNLRKIIGIALLNALSQHILEIRNPHTKIKGDLIKYLGINQNSTVMFVGLIKPLIAEISKITRNIRLVEKRRSPNQKFMEFTIKNDLSEIKESKKQVDYLFLTGTTLINDTIEDILTEYKAKARKIILIGPSASILPDILFEFGVDIVGGMKIIESKSTIKVIAEAGGTRIFKRYGKKYNLIKE